MQSGTLKQADGTPFSPRGEAATVYLADGRTAAQALTALDGQEAALSARLQTLAAAVAAVAANEE